MRHVKIDLGNQNIKHTENNARVYSTVHGIVRLNDTQIGDYSDALSGGVEALSPKDFIRVYDSVNSRHYKLYHVGDAALRQHGALLARQERGAGRYTADYAVPLILHVLQQYPDADGDYSLVLMFPPSNAMYVKDYVQAVKRSWKIGDGDSTRIINIKHVEVFMEGLGSIVNAIQGRLAPIKNDQHYLAIDIGSFTTDLVMSTAKGVFIPGMAHSLENYGINSVKERLQNSVRRQWKEAFKDASVLDDDEYLESILTNKTVNLRGRKTEDASAIVDDVCSDLINAVLNGVNQKFSRHVARIGGILLTGGGSTLMHTVLKERLDFSTIYLADERKSLFKANVRGAHYYYESLVRTGMVAV
ncbi:MAG: plasmid segregation protein ParM [Chloroflexi bacterium]|nr:plasmid segregation protein ParM [Chloroflexota bacterium]